MNKTTRLMLTGLLAATVLTTSGCGLVVRRIDRPMTAEGKTLPLDGAKKLDARLNIGVGELTVKGGASGAMDADFRYTRDDWEPRVDYAVLGDTGRLEVEQGDSNGPTWGAQQNEWEVSLPSDVPLDLRVNSGVGESTLELGELDLRNLEVQVGTGEATVDLTGIDHDLEGEITGGVGEITVKVPSDVGVRIVGTRDGVGDLVADGFMGDDNALVNAAYANAKVKIELEVRRGVGEINILQVD